MTRIFGHVMLAAQLLTAHSSAATYYVATIGADSNPGTLEAPFRHLSKAAASARQPGDTVMVLNGIYDNEGARATAGGQGSVVTLRYSGREGRPITFRALNRGKVTLDAGNTSAFFCNGAWAYFDLFNAAYILIEGFVIERGCYNAIRSNNNAHDIEIKCNEIRNIGNWTNPGGSSSPSGIYLNKNEYNFTFAGNSFHDIGGATANQEHAIYTSASNVTIVNNIFYNNTHGYGIQTAGGANVLIANNTFAFPNTSRDGQIVLWDNGAPGSLGNVTIRNNIFYSPWRVAVASSLRAAISGSCTIDHNITNVGSIFDGGSPCSLDDNRTSADPQLVNTSAAPYDFHLRSTSPAVGTGLPVPEMTCDFKHITHAARFGILSDIGALPVEKSEED